MLEKIKEELISRHGQTPLVFGEGKINADILLCGEAPGKDEVAQGRPFVGKAGANLSEFLCFLGLKREDIYITNAVKYRPFKVSEKGTVSNRTPSLKELFSERESLLKEIGIVAPKIIVTLGNSPLRSVTGDKKEVIGDVHGSIIKSGEYSIFPLYHPASIIYNRSLKEVYLSDLAELKNVIGNMNKK